MATWHFHCILVPRSGLPAQPVDAKEIFLEGSHTLWKGRARASLIADLASLGSAQPSWTDSIWTWGSEDSTCLQLTEADGGVDEVRLRIDMRSPDSQFLKKVLRSSKTLDLVVVTEVGDIVEPRFEWIMRSAERSNAAAFVEDPEAFLRALETSSNSDEQDS